MSDFCLSDKIFRNASIKVNDVKEFVRLLKKEMDDGYFDDIYTSNRYWVMGEEKMTDQKFQDILTLICEDFKKQIKKLSGDKLNG